MFYIYCYTNLINGKKYIGQTNNVEQRKRDHKSSAFNPNHKDHNQLFHQKLREYGYENFDFEILEKIDTLDKDIIDKRESYWIKFYKSFVKDGNGYNVTTGGQGTEHKRYLDQKTLDSVFADLLEGKLKIKEVAKKNKISESMVVKINNGRVYKKDNLQYPLKPQYRVSMDIKIAIAEALTQGNMTRQQIADLYGVSLSTVKRIKSGETKVNGYTFPIQKPVSTIEG